MTFWLDYLDLWLSQDPIFCEAIYAGTSSSMTEHDVLLCCCAFVCVR